MGKRTRSRAPLLLLLLCLGLGGLVAWQATRALDAPTQSTPSSVAEAPPEKTEGFGLPPLATYDEIVERPLFVRSRQPAIEEAAAPIVGTQSAVSFVLRGIVVSGDQRIAILESEATGGLVSVWEHSNLEGWTVAEVRADRVVLSREQRRIEVLLDDAMKLAPSSPRAVPRRSPPAQDPSEKGK